MSIGSISGSSGVTSIEEIFGINGTGSSSSSTAGDTASGDTVDISDEARKLFSESIHKYDSGTTSTTSTKSESEDADSSASEESSGSAGMWALRMMLYPRLLKPCSLSMRCFRFASSSPRPPKLTERRFSPKR